MTHESEMLQWRSEWLSQTDLSEPEVSSIARAAADYRRRSNFRLAANLGFGAFLMLGSAGVAWVLRLAEMDLWAVCVWITTLIAVWISLGQWHQSLAASVQPVESYSSFCHRRAGVEIQRFKVGIGFLALQFTISATWFYVDLARAGITLDTFLLGVILLTTVTLIGLASFLSSLRILAKERARMERM